MNAPYLTVIKEGKYTDAYLESAGADAPKFTPEDLKIISSPLDFVGINIYTPQYVRADSLAGWFRASFRIRSRFRTWRRLGCSLGRKRFTGDRATSRRSGM